MNSAARHLYLVRHGQTALNAEGRLRGLANPALNSVGRREAKRLAKVLKQFAPFAVYSSPLQRAVSTAEVIAKAVGVTSRVDERFNDRDYGPQTGLLKDDVIAKWGSVDAAPGVQPDSEVLARAFPALSAVLDEAGGDVVVVTHDAVIRLVLPLVDPALAGRDIPTGSWSDLLRFHDGWTVDLVLQKP